ncbi:MAG: hypothetical protein ACE5FS_13530 [Paracoccaceae bacterium]
MRALQPFLGIVASVVFLASVASPAAALDRRVKIVNKTAYTIMEFYGSNRDRETWEEDILGADVIPPNSSMMINFDDGSGYCMFDFKAVFNDGDVLTRKGVNVCEIGTYTYR